jgi:hypothetical protein
MEPVPKPKVKKIMPTKRTNFWTSTNFLGPTLPWLDAGGRDTGRNQTGKSKSKNVMPRKRPKPRLPSRLGISKGANVLLHQWMKRTSNPMAPKTDADEKTNQSMV